MLVRISVLGHSLLWLKEDKICYFEKGKSLISVFLREFGTENERIGFSYNLALEEVTSKQCLIGKNVLVSLTLLIKVKR